MKDDLRIFLLLLKHLKMNSGFVHTENICVNPALAVSYLILNTITGSSKYACMWCESAINFRYRYG